jgi:hypothetical protein
VKVADRVGGDRTLGTGDEFGYTRIAKFAIEEED